MRFPAVAILFLFLPALPGQTNRILRPVDPVRTVLLRGNTSPRAHVEDDRGPVSPSLPLLMMTIVIRPSADQQRALDQLLASQQTPGSPNFHKWLTPEEFGDRFGASPADLAAIQSWLQSEGFQLQATARGRHWLTFNGTAAQVSHAFHTGIRYFQPNGELHYSNAIEPSIPEAFAGVIGSIRGLNDFHPLRRARRLPAPLNNANGFHAIAPDDFATIYNIHPLYAAGIDGAGMTIAIAGQTDIDLSDIQAFRARFHLPANDPQVVLFGSDPGKSLDDQDEANLDLEWSGAVAPGATIIYANSTDVFTSAQFAVDQNLAPILSISYGFCEAGSGSDVVSLRTIAQQANAQGITWMTPAGDNGGPDCDEFGARQASLGPAADFPASIPETTAVGGLQLNENGGVYWNAANDANGGSAISYIPEAVWNDGIYAGGGGASILFPKPLWQSAPGVPNDGARDIPDISLAASEAHDPFIEIYRGSIEFTGGTSVSTPSFAGIVALLNHYLVANGVISQPGLGNINPALYRMVQTNPQAFHDVVNGGNQLACVQGSPGCAFGLVGYPAGPGYDLASGLGSVDVSNLVTQWSSGFGNNSTTTLTADNSGIYRSGAVVLTATVAASNGNGLPSGTVAFNIGDSPTVTVALGGGVASAMLSGSVLSLGDNTITAVYSGDSSFNGSSATTSIHVDAPDGASAVLLTVSPSPTSQSEQSGTWMPTIRLTETAGVSTTITDLLIDGVSHASEISKVFGTASLGANKALSGKVTLAGYTPPAAVMIGVSGMDASGQTWSQQVPLTLLGIQLQDDLSVSILPNTDPSCPWSSILNLSERSGFPLQVTRLLVNKLDQSRVISQIFGSSRIAPYGSLQGTICWSNAMAATTAGLEVDTVDMEMGSTFNVITSATFSTPPDNPSQLMVNGDAVMLAPDASADIAVDFSGAPVAWTTSVFPSNLTTTWLSVSPASGMGPGHVTVRAAAGMSPGVYRAVVTILAPDAIPAAIGVPVALVVGASSSTQITSLTNAASGTGAAGSGMVMNIAGTALASATSSTRSSLLPLSLGGVSVTVNGVNAPIFSVSPTLISVQVPYEVGSGLAAVGVNNQGQIAGAWIPVTASAPGIYADANGSLTPSASAKAGDTLQLTMTGDGDITTTQASGMATPNGTSQSKLPKPRLPVSVTVGGETAQSNVLGIAGGSIGKTQVSFTVPADVAVGPQPVVVSVGGVASPPVMIMVTQ